MAQVFSISSVAVWNEQEPLGKPAPTRLGLGCEEERGSERTPWLVPTAELLGSREEPRESRRDTAG